MSCEILGLGTALPPYAISQEAAFTHARGFAKLDERQTRLLHTIYRKAAVQRRYSVLLDESISDGGFYYSAQHADDPGPTTHQRMEQYAAKVVPLSLTACRAALEQSGVAASEITQLITVSCTGFFSPGLDAAIIEQLSLPRWVGRTQIGFMGCHGAINGLRAALASAGADPNARVLLCAAELCTLHFRYGWHPQTAVANALFADGAAAMVGKSPAATAASENAWAVADCASFLLPDSTQDMTWRIGNNGFEMTLSDRVPDLIQKNLRGWMEHWLRSHGKTVADIQSWIVHPGGPSIIDAVAHSLNLPESAVAESRQVLAEHGNMSSPTVLFILDRVRKRQASKPCVMLAFGPGLVAEAALLI
jgi:predicted naringenin-chalcone synthase